MSRTERTVYGARHMADFSAVRPGPLAFRLSIISIFRRRRRIFCRHTF